MIHAQAYVNKCHRNAIDRTGSRAFELRAKKYQAEALKEKTSVSLAATL